MKKKIKTIKEPKPVEKPKLWKYKSGDKKGKLRPQARKYLSYRLKKHHYQRRIEKKEIIQKKLIEPPTPTPDKIPIQRIRRQVVENFRSPYPPYYVSVRAMTINPTINEKGLKIALLQGKRLFEREKNINLKEYNLDYVGFAIQRIGDKEDRILNDLGVYAEVFIAYEKNSKRLVLKTYKIR